MSDIFFSYASDDRERIIPLVRALESTDWTIFWDRVIPPGKTWRQVIGAEMKNCRCVIVVWSKKSVESEWVQEEAEEAKRKQILVPIMIDDVAPPFGFGAIQAADFTRWDGSKDSPLFDEVKKAIATLLGSPPAPSEESKIQKMKEDRRRAEEDLKRAKEEETAREIEEQHERALEAKLEAERERRKRAEARARDLENKAKQEALKPQTLQEILPGSWQAEIAVAYGVGLTATFTFDSRGGFKGQILSPMMGVIPVQGQWSASNNALTLQGQQTVAFIATPYSAVVQFSTTQPRELRGISNAGEQVTLRKIS